MLKGWSSSFKDWFCSLWTTEMKLMMLHLIGDNHNGGGGAVVELDAHGERSHLLAAAAQQ